MSLSLFLHLTTKLAWEDALKVGTYSISTKGKTLNQIGFIHGSFPDQLEEVARFVFTGSTEELVVLHLDINKLEANGLIVRIEDGGNGKLYPHLYDAIPCDLVDRVSSAYLSENGHLSFQKFPLF